MKKQNLFGQNQNSQSFFAFIRSEADRHKMAENCRTAETYLSALSNFKKFRRGRDLPIGEITASLMEQYEAYLVRSNVMRNTSSFYMRILRAVYNKAVECELVCQSHPFRHVYTGVDKTVKRAITTDDIRRIKNLDLTADRKLEFVRDMFMFSFYTRGMSFVDMAYLQKSDLQGGILTYRRRKTNQLINVRWEQCMQDIVNRHAISGESPFLLPIIKHPRRPIRRQYRNALSYHNNKLKTIAMLAGLDVNLTMYVARHSWASAAYFKNIPVSVISAGMGHSSEHTTEIYLSSICNKEVDAANSLILGILG